MPLEGRDAATVWDVVQACRRVREFVAGMDADTFRADARTHYAVIAQILILGEAARRLSEPFRAAHPTVAWKEMAGMRDVLVRGYDRVDLDEVWRTATTDIVDVLAMLELVLADETP